jgi:predicted nucleic acid-binding protein
MTRRVLLDTNMLIGAFDSEDGNVAHIKAKEEMVRLLKEPDTKLAITPLIRYEVLRGAPPDKVVQLEKILNDFQEFEVRGVEAHRAAELFRLAKEKEIKLDKRSFDLFHCVCAEMNDLELVAQDRDIPKIQKLIQDSKQNAQTH